MRKIQITRRLKGGYTVSFIADNKTQLVQQFELNQTGEMLLRINYWLKP